MASSKQLQHLTYRKLVGPFQHAERDTSPVRSRRGDQPCPQAHQLGLARHPGLQEDLLKVGFRCCRSDAKRRGGLGQRAPGEQAWRAGGFRPASDQRRASAPSCSSGCAPMNTAATAVGCSRVRKSLPVSGRTWAKIGGTSVRRIASPVLPMPAAFLAVREMAQRSSDAADAAVACRMPWAL